MGYTLDVPGRMSVRAVAGAEGERYVEFYTANFPVRFDVEEARKLIVELDRWVRAVPPRAPEGAARREGDGNIWIKTSDL